MKKTLNIDSNLLIQLQEMSDRMGKNMSELVDFALRRFLEPPKPKKKKSRLPTFNGGKCRVDVSDHDELSRIMEEH
jgi:hypothetical protein